MHEFTWSDIVTRDYADAHPQCLKQISAAMAAVAATSVPELVKAFGVCEAAGLGPNARTELFAYALESMPQVGTNEQRLRFDRRCDLLT